MKWYVSPEGVALQKKYGKWVGDWGRGRPQMNWIVGILNASQ